MKSSVAVTILPLVINTDIAHLFFMVKREAITYSGDKEANEPGVAVQGHDPGRETVVADEADGAQEARHIGKDAQEKVEDGCSVEAIGIGPGALQGIEIGHRQLLPADEVVVGDHDAAYGTQEAGVAHQPGEDLAAGIGYQLPGEDEDTEDAGDETACPEVDAGGAEVGKIVGG